MTNGNLPDGWASTTLEDCVDILDNRRVPINAEERQQRISGKNETQLYPYYGATGKVGLIDDFLFDEEIILLGEDGAPFLDFGKDKAYYVRGKSWVKNHAHVLRAKKGVATNLFLMHYLNLFEYRDYVTGTTRLKLNQAQMRRFPVILPPLPEQERIVAKIEELFTQLDAGTAALKRVQAGLKRYKASVLKAAVEGRLFENREVESSSELPDGWKWTTIGDVIDSLDNMRVPVNKKERENRQGKYPYYGANGQVDWIDGYIFDEPLVLLVEDETFTGREKPFSYKITGKTWVNNHAHVLRAKANILDVDYLNYSLAYYPFTPMTTGTTGRKKLTKSAMMAARYALPPFPEQQRIVAEVERRLEGAALARASRLRQAVLKSAFEGRLV